MQFHRGRMLDHVHLRVRDLEASKRFYRAVLKSLGLNLTFEDGERFGCDELYVDRADDYVTRVHLAFQADDTDDVANFHTAGLAAGGRDNGAPGEREYHPGYYAAFLLDPDGNNIEAVWHGPATRSAESITVTPTTDHPAAS